MRGSTKVAAFQSYGGAMTFALKGKCSNSSRSKMGSYGFYLNLGPMVSKHMLDNSKFFSKNISKFRQITGTKTISASIVFYFLNRKTKNVSAIGKHFLLLWQNLSGVKIEIE